MSLITILENLFIGPLKLLFELVYSVAERLIVRPGYAIIILSLVVNVLLLPLQRRADVMQEEARDKEEKLRDGVAHIKKTFTGDERMMILQTYYRQNDYRPTDVLNGSVSLLLEVPFFMAAYQFLANLAALDNKYFGPIADLGAPDGMLVIGTIAINVLPILMTLINILSGAIYSKGFPLKTKLQMYGLALLFLVVLYDSPSGLVFYWTLNNLFSLCKNIVRRSTLFQKFGVLGMFVAGIAITLYGLFVYRSVSVRRNILVVGIGVLLMLPCLFQLLKSRVKLPKVQLKGEPNKKMFLLGSLFLTVQTGILIPSTYIAASPQEYVDPNYYHDPLLYIVMATILAAGTFLVWMRVFYWLASPKGKVLFDRAVWILCGAFLVNYMFFGRNLGMLYSNLQFAEHELYYLEYEEILNLIVMVLLAIVMYIAAVKWPRQVVSMLLVGTIALGSMSVLNMATIRKETKSIEELSKTTGKEIPSFRLSTEGKNVVVIMLDRAVGQMIPYIFNEKPELKEQFDGFVHYENTVSFGAYTVFGSPALVGGYEYTPVEMNKRSDEPLVDKHNEALKVMPVLFSENGYETTILDPVYANYQWLPDLSIYDEYPEIDAYLTNGVFVEGAQRQAEIDANYRNFFCFSIMKSVPVSLQRTVYCSGTYNRPYAPENVYAGQMDETMSIARGYRPTTMDEYAILCNMDTMTEIVDGDVDTYMFIDNNLTHEPMLLQEPEYVPAAYVNNVAYDAANADRFTVDGKTLIVDDAYKMGHYHANMAAMLKLGEWFDYLRENDAYDNTRIIIVSDHGRLLSMMEELKVYTGPDTYIDLSQFNALLMVKDFGSTGFTTSHEFMTNADVPTLSVEGLIENPVNPFTGKLIDNSEKYAHDQILTRSHDWGVVRNQGNTFQPSKWASVKDDLWDFDDWSFLETEEVLTEYALP